ncbi:hypothetical protein [Yoonia sp. 208BN28-4]|uniref:hypothetical protein n=1 Tax=Yoonia sp. 208BN28-4 TaxID=3126505 RepID=UPI00309C33A5
MADDWTYSLRIVGDAVTEYRESGDRLFVGTETNGPWNGSEIYQSVPATPQTDCDFAQAYEIDHYVGVGPDYLLQVLITFERNADDSWSGVSPDIYFDVYDGAGQNDADPVSYFAEDGTAKVQSLTCVDDVVTARYSFRGTLQGDGGATTPLQISGTGTATMPVYPYEDY